MSGTDDWSWSASALYACPCGELVVAQRWRWIDCEARAELAASLRAKGPLVGACASCGRTASGGGAWLEVRPSGRNAVLVLSSDRRGDLISALQSHLDDVQGRTERSAPWLLQPALAFAPPNLGGWPEDHVEVAPWPAPARPTSTAAEQGPREPSWPSEIAALQVGRGGAEASAPAAPQPQATAATPAPTPAPEPKEQELSDRSESAAPDDQAPEPDAAEEASEEGTLEETFPGRRMPRPPEDAEPPASRRPVRAPTEGTGQIGQAQAIAPARPAEEGEVGERSALRAAVARAISGGPGATPPPRPVEADAPRPRRAPEADAPRPPAARPGSKLQVTPDVQRTCLATLSREGGGVVVAATVSEATARLWTSAPVSVRPIHLRGLGYPLVGVRCVADASEPLVIDAVLDVGEPQTADVFKSLAQQFRIRLTLRAEGGATTRELVAPELQRNAAMCLESAQAMLRAGEYPQDAFRSAREALAARTAAQRLEPSRHAVSEDTAAAARGSAAAAWLALERLDLASRKETLSRLLEVDGLPIETYESIRSEILAAAIDFGLPTPARFWRRWLASDQASDLPSFVARLVATRTAAVARGGDLPPEHAEAAWRGLLDLCQHKDITPPPELSKALGLGRSSGRRSSQPPVVASGEIRDAAPASAEPRPSAPRLKDLLARLHEGATEADVRAVLGVWSELSEADLTGLLPAFAELGARVVPELIPSLRSPRRQVRQAAAILLGHIGDRKAVEPLIAMLSEEATEAWIDAAQALGNFGPRVVGPLCAMIRGAPAGRRELLGIRLGRALAALAKAEGEVPGTPSRVAVENLLDVGDQVVASAARRALGIVAAVRDEGAGDEAEAARLFSQLASDAITAPEVDAFSDDDELEVEVGDD